MPRRNGRSRPWTSTRVRATQMAMSRSLVWSADYESTRNDTLLRRSDDNFLGHQPQRRLLCGLAGSDTHDKAHTAARTGVVRAAKESGRNLGFVARDEDDASARSPVEPILRPVTFSGSTNQVAKEKSPGQEWDQREFERRRSGEARALLCDSSQIGTMPSCTARKPVAP
jgi:hypothetical protein